jgi:hypothetical protein
MEIAIMVTRSESGCYEIPGAAEREDWEYVQEEQETVERLGDLQGWEPYQEVYRCVDLRGEERTYFVGEVVGEISVQVLDGNLYGDHYPSDDHLREAADAYVRRVREAIERVYPHSDVSIDLQRNTSGASAHTYADGVGTFDARIVDDLCNSAWEAWTNNVWDIEVDVDALRQEAAQAGDEGMVALCDRASEGDSDAYRECRWAVATARGMLDGGAA